MERLLNACQTSCSMYPSISTVSQLFEPQVQKIAVFRVPQPTCLFPPWRRPCDYNTICCMDGKTIQCLSNPSQHVPIYLEYFPSYTMLKSMHKSKNRYFYHIFVSPGGTPLGQSCNMLHGWKDNSMLINCLAACAHLTITVCEIERDNCEIDKTRRTVRDALCKP